MDEELDIIVTGFDVAERQAEAGLIRVFGLDQQRARRFMRELPVVAKRCANPASAQRYAQALRSIGARVELLPVASLDEQPDDAPRNSMSSLPIPAPSVMARLRESMRVERETQRAIKRFRTAEGLDVQDEPLPEDVDLMNPTIPKAPALPHDLHRLPNAELPSFSERPTSVWSDPLSADREPRSSVPSRPHADAKRPPPPPTHSSMRPARGRGDERDVDSIRPSSIGLAHAATASGRPGLGTLSTWSHRPMPKRRPRLIERWPLGVALLALAYAGLHFSGVLDSEADRRERAWASEGIDAGEHAPAAEWLRQSPKHVLRGLPPSEARELVDRLTRAGAVGVHAVRIRATAQKKSAPALLIELPDDAARRRILLFHSARARRLEPPLIPDRGERYHMLTWR